ncbi:hypothetical protein HMPREF9554_00438 [Treponema phagedenis F0421]|nr:hypothetical protein HMPREF9554_00438 [Treponema phagedenis F0421]
MVSLLTVAPCQAPFYNRKFLNIGWNQYSKVGWRVGRTLFMRKLRWR